MASVLPSHRRCGVGGRLLGALSEHARLLGRGALVGRVLEADVESRAFLDRRGFAVLIRERPVALDLGRVSAERPTAPVGVELVSLAERSDLAEAAWLLLRGPLRRAVV